MEATTLGVNRTGTATAPERSQAMLDATHQLTTPQPIDTSASDAQHIVYISESEALGSIPPPPSLKGMVQSGIAKLKGSNPSIFMDKIGERIAFERGGVRLYDALITKYQALSQTDSDLLGEQRAAATSTLAPVSESPAQALQRIRADELAHFKMLCEVMQELGGDPTAQTPCADVIATASMGLIQVVSDPRTTLAQSMSAILTAELTDNAGWELLIELAEEAGENDISARFLSALSEEQNHLITVTNWLRTLVLEDAGTPAL